MTTDSLEDRLTSVGDHIEPPPDLWNKVEALISAGAAQQTRPHGPAGSGARPPRLVRRVAGGVAVGAALSIAGVAAAATFGPGLDRDEADRFVEAYESHQDVHLDGWRPELNAERVRCMYEDGRPEAETFASEFPLADRMTVEHLIDECTSGNDSARSSGDVDREAAELCSETNALRVPVIATGFPSCANAGLDTVADPEHFLEALHQRRAFELTMKISANRCMDHDEAEAWLDDGLGHTPDPLTQSDEFDNPLGPCWNVWIMWDQGLIYLQPGSPVGE